jgi:hypothetical protein
MTSALALLALLSAATPGADPAPAATPDLTPAPPTPSLDFDLLPRPPPAAARQDALLASQVAQRRTMLRLHQGLGLATWAALAATAVVGQLDFDDRFRGGGDTGRWHRAHRTLALSSAALFAGTASLALLATADGLGVTVSIPG